MHHSKVRTVEKIVEVPQAGARNWSTRAQHKPISKGAEHHRNRFWKGLDVTSVTSLEPPLPLPPCHVTGGPQILNRMLRGGNQNVEGCWWFPYLKIEKLPSCHFMFLIDMKFLSNIFSILFNQSLSFSDPHLRKIEYKHEVFLFRKYTKEKRYLGLSFSKNRTFWVPDLQR